MFQTVPTDLDGDSLPQTENIPLGQHVRGAPVVSLEFLILTECKLPAFLTEKTAALQGAALQGWAHGRCPG